MTEGEKNLTLTFFAWWYGEAFTKFFIFIKAFLAYLADTFSAKACLTTLFAPWKRDVINTTNLSLQDRFQVLMLNLSSRIIGALVKLATLAAFLITLSVAFIISVLATLLWLSWPLVAVSLIIKGLTTLSL